ncbi:MAG: CehA/McbA family metallohydrolase [Candidatus Latescibacteria bacterium]|nr:CehA/McbA family metallohydrolase [Candidatus Latescibacterota bacterium]
MAKSRKRRTKAKPVTVPVDIKGALNFPRGAIRGRFLRELATWVRRFPKGDQISWGISFEMASPRSKARVIVLNAGDEVTIPVGATANYLCLLHTFAKSPSDQTVYMEAQQVGEYELVYAKGKPHRSPVRARLDVEVPESPGPAQMSMPFTMPTTDDPEAPPQGIHWGRQQTGVSGGRGEPLIYALKNPHPSREIQALVIRGQARSPLIVAGVTCYSGTDHPLRHLMRRMYRVKTKSGGTAEVETLEVDMGAVARTDRTIGPRNAAWIKAGYAGADSKAEPVVDGEAIYSIYGAVDATVSAQLKRRKEPVEFSLGEAYRTGKSVRGGVTLERLGGRKQWMEVEIIDGSTGQPTPVRLHMSGARGEYIAPYGHHEQVNANWFEDYGADLKVSGRSYAYVPGHFTTDMPTGPLYVEMTKGFEYRPTRCKVTVKPGQRKLTLKIDRWKDLRSEGWVTADTHVHFLSPQTAWLEAQGEGVNVVNLLASQWGRLFTNVGDISGRLGVAEDDTIVWVGTENRNHMLGHISMCGTKGLPVFPMCCGGVGEAWVGDPDYRALTEWAEECSAKDGVVIRPHFPYCGFTEDPVLAVKGVVDALEIRQNRNGGFPLQEWYRYLNNGYRVAVAGGTDKMGAYCALGSLRTYAKLNPNRPFTFENWAKAVRAGRTISTNGPLLDMQVEGMHIGETLKLPATGGRIQVKAVAESAWMVGSIEIVVNGQVVAREEAKRGATKVRLSARVPITGPGWIAARCNGAGNTPTQYMAAHTSPVYLDCGGAMPYDGPALEHMLNLTRGGIEYLETISTRFDDREQERMIRIYREVEAHLQKRSERGA